MTAITANWVSAPAVVGILGNFVEVKIGEGENVTQINLNGIVAGRLGFHSAPFRVYMNDDVVARSITLTGLIEASSVYDGLLCRDHNGAKIRTAAFLRCSSYRVRAAHRCFHYHLLLTPFQDKFFV
ncbi:hypothetical protein ACFRAM_01090 [Paenibacillus sp. NPDC056722]|uniref:hypothetical protein n=1 Tax=Paenibacillus sp. NPDC056722 TaxID=3345924 RepID=UPI0036C1E148